MKALQSLFRSGDRELSMKRLCAFLCIVAALFILVYCNINNIEPHDVAELLATACTLLAVEPAAKVISSFSNNDNNETKE